MATVEGVLLMYREHKRQNKGSIIEGGGHLLESIQYIFFVFLKSSAIISSSCLNRNTRQVAMATLPPMVSDGTAL